MGRHLLIQKLILLFDITPVSLFLFRSSFMRRLDLCTFETVKAAAVEWKWRGILGCVHACDVRVEVMLR